MSATASSKNSVEEIKNEGPDAANNKRKPEGDSEGTTSNAKMMKLGEPNYPKSMPVKAKRAREIRLEQNRKAARESRRRKKVMIEELQRSVIFFSRANGTLKDQNDRLTRFLMQAQMQVAAIETNRGNPLQMNLASLNNIKTEQKESKDDQKLANTVAAQAVYESKGFPSSAARAAAEAMNGSLSSKEPPSSEATTTPKDSKISADAVLAKAPPMEPGVTMTAMENFQQAASAAMQAAMGQLQQNVPGVSLSQLSAEPAGTNAQQAYTDTMTAFAMQQAAAAAAAGILPPGIQFFQPFLPLLQQQQQQLLEQKSNAEQQKSPDGKKS